MKNKKRQSNNYPSLFDKKNLNGGSTKESAHLKGTGVCNTYAGMLSEEQLTDSEPVTSDQVGSKVFSKGNVCENINGESQPERASIIKVGNQDDSQVKEQHDISSNPNNFNNPPFFIKNLDPVGGKEREIDRISDTNKEITLSEPKSRSTEENLHQIEPQTLIATRSDDRRLDRKTVDDSINRKDHSRIFHGLRQRDETERREFERQEKKRKERERKERERQEKELQYNMSIEQGLLYKSEFIPSVSSDCYMALYTEKKSGLGEDACPLIYRSDDTMCVGVFDGLGGAGATEYPTLTFGNKTGAYLSSRVVRAICYDWLKKNGKIDYVGLKDNISKQFNKLLSIWKIKPSGLRSGFVRVLPTTLAMVEATRSGNNTTVISYWAGDSRNYVLVESGLKQLSCDDLRQPKDPLENLRSDDALSNCICQDKPFEINVKRLSFNEPIIILSATDGCFGYLLTPMHFEYILLDCMMKSSNCKEWSEEIRKTLYPISSDDFSIGLQIVDRDYNYWKNLLHSRYEFLKESVIGPIEQMKSAHEKAIQECAMCEQRLYNGITESWHQYKDKYMLTNQSYHNDN